MISLKNTLEAIKTKLSGHETRLSTIEDRQVYSTDEKVIGTWLDGKPLYRKVYSGKALYKGNRVDDFPTSTISTMVKMELCLYGQNPWTAQYYNSSSSYGRVQVADNEIQLYIGDTPAKPCYYVVILEYTKTTD